jgi:hypothetical protein
MQLSITTGNAGHGTERFLDATSSCCCHISFQNGNMLRYGTLCIDIDTYACQPVDVTTDVVRDRPL